jgi:hypothetical protein
MRTTTTTHIDFRNKKSLHCFKLTSKKKYCELFIENLFLFISSLSVNAFQVFFWFICLCAASIENDYDNMQHDNNDNVLWSYCEVVFFLSHEYFYDKLLSIP